MTTPRRIQFTGATAIVSLEGARGGQLFGDEEDALKFEALLERAVIRFRPKVYAACFLPSHIEMVITTGDQPLSRIMQQLTVGYTRYLNARTGARGHVFAGRYRAVLMDAAAYLPEAIRQVHLLPVHAGIVSDAQRYLWSGHRALLGLAHKPYLAREEALKVFHADPERAVSVYRAFVSRGATGGRRLVDSDTARDGILGDTLFRHSLEERQRPARRAHDIIPLDQLFAVVEHCGGLGAGMLTSPARDHRTSSLRMLAAHIALDLGLASAREIADHTSRSASTLSRTLRQLEQKLMTDPHLQALNAQIRETITHA